MRENMVIGISSNGGMNTIDRRWLLQKNQWKWIMRWFANHSILADRSLAYDHIIICHLHCRHVTVRIETIIMYKGNVVLHRDHQHQSLRLVRPTIRSYLCVHDVIAVFGCKKKMVVVFISSIPAQKVTSDDQCIQETSIGHIRRSENRLALGTKGHCDSTKD
jgi:hypothetical protein